MARHEKISVCLPVYNGAKYLAQAIESVLTQTHSNLELLISDDLSNDDSEAIARKYAAQDQRVVYWRNETNLGIFANYNACLQRVCGSFVKLFAQDDVLEPTCCERQLEQLVNNENIALVTVARAVIDGDGQQSGIERFFDQSCVIKGTDVITEYMRTFLYRTGTPSQVMFRASRIGDGFDIRYTLSGDIEYFFEILESGDYMYLNEVLVKFRRHEESVTVSSLKNMSFVSDAFRLADRYEHYALKAEQSGPAVRKTLIEGVIKKVNNAIYDRKVVFDARPTAGTAVDGLAEKLDFEKIAYEVLFYAAQVKLELEERVRMLKKLENDLKDKSATADADRRKLESQIDELRQRLNDVQSSSSWKITQPLRWLSRTLQQ